MGPCKACSHPQREFVEAFEVFGVVVCWRNRRSWFLCVSFGEVCVLNHLFGFSIGGFEFFRLLGWFAGKRWFLVKLRFSSKVCGVLGFLRSFLSFPRLIADSVVVEVLFAVFLWFAEVNVKNEKQSFQSRGACRS